MPRKAKNLICSVEGCGKHAGCYLLCRNHLWRQRKYGTTDLPARPTGCKVEGCDRKHYAHGQCELHHRRLKYKPRKIPKTVAFARSAAASQTDECIPWPFAKAKKTGHGFIKSKSTPTHSAHNFVLRLAKGDPSGDATFACHRCRLPSCVNPRHLYWGTALTNSDDKYADGTMMRGNKVWKAKLTDEGAREIFLSTDKAQDLADRYGVAIQTIHGVWGRKVWMHATEGLKKPYRWKGPQSWQLKHRTPKLSDEQVRHIRSASANTDLTALANEFGVHRQYLYAVRSGRARSNT